MRPPRRRVATASASGSRLDAAAARELYELKAETTDAKKGVDRAVDNLKKAEAQKAQARRRLRSASSSSGAIRWRRETARASRRR